MAVDLEYYGVPPADYREQELRTRLTATAGQTTFSAPYSPGNVDVFYNGAKLDPFSEFTGTDGANIVLASGAFANGDIVEVISRSQVQVSNIYTKQQVDNLASNFYGVATGTGNAQVVTTVPTFAAFLDGMDIKVRAVAANASTTPTIAINGLPAKTIVFNSAAVALFGNDWVAGSELTLRYNQTLDKLVLIDGAVTSIAPAQFLNNNQNVNAFFVQRALGNRSGVVSANTTQTLTTAQVGSLISSFGATGPITLTLPNINAFAPVSGVSYLITNPSLFPVTLSSTSNFSQPWAAAGGSTTFVLQSGVSVECISDGGSWNLVGGGASGSLLANGLQRLPSGFLMQWGATATVTTGTSVTVTLPVAMPNGLLQVMITPQSPANGTVPFSGGWQAINNATFTLRNNSTLSGQYSWMAIGW
jgi:hypothetical protein